MRMIMRISKTNLPFEDEEVRKGVTYRYTDDNEAFVGDLSNIEEKKVSHFLQKS